MKWGQKLLGFILSGLFLWLALRGLDWTRVLQTLSGVRWSLVLILPFSYTCEHVFRTLRWKVILGELPIPFFHLYSGIIIGYFSNNVFPARAGEIIRSLYLGRKNRISTSMVFGSIVLERFLDGLVVVSMIGFCLLRFPLDSAYKVAGATAVGFYLMVFLLILTMQFHRDSILVFFTFVLKPFPISVRGRVLGLTDSFIDGFKTIREGPKILSGIALSFIGWGFSVVSTYICMCAFSLPYGIEVSVLLISVLSLGAMIPSSPGMIGIFEICCRLVFVGILGMNKDLGMSVGLFVHAANYIFVICVGACILFYENIRLGELQTEAESPASSPMPDPL